MKSEEWWGYLGDLEDERDRGKSGCESGPWGARMGRGVDERS